MEKYFDNIVNFPSQQWSTFTLTYGSSENVIHEMALLLLSRPFPFKRNDIKDPHVLFKRLTSFKPKISKASFSLKNVKTDRELFPWTFGTKYFSYIFDSDSYAIDQLTDYFTEEYRMRALRKDSASSPFQDWQDINYIKSILSSLKNKNVTNSTLREAIYAHSKECTQFKATLSFSIYELFKAKKVLDISAGWGDRLLGALARDVDLYVGYDPNVALKPGHDEMIECFAKDKNKFIIRYEPFESSSFTETVDLVFTSPPFFDFEKYSDLPGQSTINYPTLEEWLVYFLFTSVNKAWSALNINGYMALHITDVYDVHVCQILNLFILSYLANSCYLGVIGCHGSSNNGKPKPIWVYKKCKSDMAKTLKARQLFEKQFPDIYNFINK